MYVCCNNLKDRLNDLRNGVGGQRPETTCGRVTVDVNDERLNRYQAHEFYKGELSHHELVTLILQIQRNQVREASKGVNIEQIMTSPLYQEATIGYPRFM